MPIRFWTRETIVQAIRSEAFHGQPLCYSSMQERLPALLRAAERAFGSWSLAVEAAGFDYSTIRRYRRWSRDRVIERIRYWHAQNADLSWRHVATKLDPALAAATLHGQRFHSWTEALESAGIDPEQVMRYRRWTLGQIEKEIELLTQHGVSLDQESLKSWAPDLRAAIYRVDGALELQRQALQRQQRGELPVMGATALGAMLVDRIGKRARATSE